MSHTEGPWFIGPTPFYLKMGQQGEPITIRSHHHTEEIATVWTCCLPTKKNAQLIAAAPEMLDVLEEISSFFKENDPNADQHPVVIRVNQIIKKAKGL